MASTRNKMIGVIRLAVMVGAVMFESAPSLATDLFHIELSNFQANSAGYSGNLVNGPGAMISAPVTYIRFDRTVSKLGKNRFRIDVNYPAAMMHGEFASGHYLPQTGMQFKCGLRPSGARAGVQLEYVNDQASRFWDFHNGPPPIQRKEDEPDYIRAVKGYSDGVHICSLIVRVNRPVSDDIQYLGQFVTTGLPDLAVRQDVDVQKSYSDIAQPYLDFLKDDNVSFKTNDEFWFLVAASVHHDQILTPQSTTETAEFVEGWVAHFALYVVSQTGNENLIRYVHSMLPPDIKLKNTYGFVQVLDERVYEL